MEWKMEDLLKELLSELELREEHCTMSKSESSQYSCSDKDKKRVDELNTASVLLAKTNLTILVRIVRVDMPTKNVLL